MPTAAPGPSAPRRRRPRNWRLLIAVTVGVLSPVCAAGSLAGYVWYDNATAPDRSTPGLVVRQYLQATFEDNDAARASLFTCGKPASLTEVQETLADIHQRESRFGVKITVGWDSFNTQEQGKDATVTLNLLIRVPEANGYPSESQDHWAFTTVNNNGWRVCGAHKVG
jgi:hypothetical protein